MGQQGPWNASSYTCCWLVDQGHKVGWPARKGGEGGELGQWEKDEERRNGPAWARWERKREKGIFLLMNYDKEFEREIQRGLRRIQKGFREKLLWLCALQL